MAPPIEQQKQQKKRQQVALRQTLGSAKQFCLFACRRRSARSLARSQPRQLSSRARRQATAATRPTRSTGRQVGAKLSAPPPISRSSELSASQIVLSPFVSESWHYKAARLGRPTFGRPKSLNFASKFSNKIPQNSCPSSASSSVLRRRRRRRRRKQIACRPSKRTKDQTRTSARRAGKEERKFIATQLV